MGAKGSCLVLTSYWERIRIHHVIALVLAVAVGLLAALGAVGFRLLIAVFQGVIWPGSGDFAERVAHAPWWLILFAPALAGLIVGPIIHRFAPEARGPGVAEVIKSVARDRSKIRHRVTAFKAMVTSLLIGAGASVGREGPVVQIGASLGSSMAQLLGLSSDLRRALLASGAAAGIAATFNAPIAGTLFAVEIILLDINVSYITLIIVASVTGSVFARHLWGDLPSLAAGGFTLEHGWELGLYLLLGMLAGLVAVVFIRLLFGLDKLFTRAPLPNWSTPALGGLLLGTLALFLPQVLGVGYSTVNMAVAGSLTLTLAVAILGAKLLATALCIGSGMSGGVFAPSLVLGASLGAATALAVNTMFPELGLDPGHYALAGMGAVVAGTTLAPITAILTIFELTSSYQVILPVMAACIAASGTARWLSGYSVYERKLLAQGMNIIRGHDVSVLRCMSVSDVMITSYESLSVDNSALTVLKRVINSPYAHFPVLDRKGRLAGVLSARDLRPALEDINDLEGIAIAADIMTPKSITLKTSDNLETALDLFNRFRISFAPVTDPHDPTKIEGILKREDLMSAYQERIFKDRMLSCPLK
ncbi:MAG: chloride channel protein [Desulfovibrio sp.]|nr:MAG: chloride channel protein [Desulfovibrio sp.]